MSARKALTAFECRKQCAERGEPPCWEIDQRLDPPPEFDGCSVCNNLTDARIAALSAAGFAVVPRYATNDMVIHAREMTAMHGEPLHYGDLWLAMVIASQAAALTETETEKT